MTPQREVDAALCLSIHVTSKCLGDTVTSNQSVFFSLSLRLTCFDSLLPSPVEEVYVQQLINRCKAWCASAVELIFNQTLRTDSWHRDLRQIKMSNCLFLCRGCLCEFLDLVCSGEPNRSVCIEMWTTVEIQFVLAVVNTHSILSNDPACAAYSVAILIFFFIVILDDRRKPLDKKIYILIRLLLHNLATRRRLKMTKNPKKMQKDTTWAKKTMFYF